MNVSFATDTRARFDANVAFEIAIRTGRLSSDPKSPHFAGHYMYMGRAPNSRIDMFKHRDTRAYLD